MLDGVYGEPATGEEVIPVADPAVARLLAAAHLRVHGQPAGVSTGDGIEVVGADAPAPRWVEPDEEVLRILTAAEAPTVLAGPGVVRDGAVADLHAVAAGAGVGVLNTWGAKGVFDWRSRHHLATAGLQQRDFELGGLQAADVVLAVGIDPLEAPPQLWRNGPARVVEVEPGTLGPLAERWHRPHRPIEVPPLREALAAVTQEGWRAEGTPMAPSRVTWHYGQVAADGGLVAADAGVAGYWVARTLPTAALGTVVVPAERAPGFAAACGLVARLRNPRRPVLAVSDDEPTAVLAAADALGVHVPVEVWSPNGDALDPTAHWARLTALVEGDGELASLLTDPGQLAAMVDAAGPVVAWGGLSA